MTEKVLPYNRSVVGQETGYWCGPAATQVVLNSRGVIARESDLAREIGTTTNGTDYVGLIERVLDRALPEARYTSVYLEQDPATQAQKNRLWTHIVRSINAGYGVVMNWVAPPSNKPRGVKGSTSPRYSGGTTYHYVAALGYDDVARAVWIADSGFQPQGYWISFDQCASLIPPKGYCYADTAATPPAPTPPQTPPVAVLSKAMGDRLVLDRYAAVLPAVSQSLAACECTTVERIAMWCAQIGHESGGLFYTEEIASGAAYEGRRDLGNTQPGDGVRFKGRSWIQITGRANYTALSIWAHGKGLIPTPTFFVDQPQQLAADQYAGLGAAWYWVVARLDINALSDKRDIELVSRRINGTNPKTGRANGIDDRIARYNRALAMGDALLTLTAPPGGISMADAKAIEDKLDGKDGAGKPYDYRQVDLDRVFTVGDGPSKGDPDVEPLPSTPSVFDHITKLARVLTKRKARKGQKLDVAEVLSEILDAVDRIEAKLDGK